MGLFDQTYYDAIAASSITHQAAFDGTYVWFTTRNSDLTTRRLYRLRDSDKQLIRPNGSIGDGTNSYTTLNTTYSGYSALTCDGTYVYVADGNGQGVAVYSASDMSFVSRTGLGTSYVAGNNTTACRTGGYSYFPGWNNSAGQMSIFRVNESTRTGSLWYSSPSTNAVPYHTETDGTYVYLLGPANTPIEKIRISDATRVAASTALNAQTWGSPVYDSGTDSLYVALLDGEYVRVRCSDMAFIRPNGTADTYANSRVTSGIYSSIMNSGYRCFIDSSGYLWTSSGSAGAYTLQRRKMDPTNSMPVVGTWANQLRCCMHPWVASGDTLYFAEYFPGWGASGLMWMPFNVTQIVANLTDVSPATGPKITLTFDSQVTASGTTTGAATAGVGVTSVTAVDTTHIDLNIDYPPVHPLGQAQQEHEIQPPAAAAYLL